MISSKSQSREPYLEDSAALFNGSLGYYWILGSVMSSDYFGGVGEKRNCGFSFWKWGIQELISHKSVVRELRLQFKEWKKYFGRIIVFTVSIITDCCSQLFSYNWVKQKEALTLYLVYWGLIRKSGSFIFLL